MADQTERLELATVKAEIGSDIISRFSNDAVDADPIPTESGDIQNLKQVAARIEADGQIAITQAVADGIVDLAVSVESAEASAGRADSAAAMAASLSNPFPTTAAGLAATSGSGATNRYFSIPGTGNTLSTAYRNDAGTAVLIGSAASDKAIQAVKSDVQSLNAYFGNVPSGFSFLLSDAVGQGVLGAKNTGEIVIGVLETLKLISQTLTSQSLTVQDAGVIGSVQFPGYLLTLMNDVYQVCLAVRDDGTVGAGTIEANRIVVKTLEVESILSSSFTALADSIRRTLPDVPHVIGYGQSLGAGVNASPLQTLTTRFNAVRFNGGARAQDGGADVAANHTSLVPYVETTAVTGDGTGYETPMGGALDCIYERLLDEHSGFQSSDLMLLGSVPGQGGKTIAQLSKGAGNGYYERILADIQYGYALAQAQGKTYAPVAAYWIQGESDQSAGTTKAAYKTALAALIDNVNTDAAALLGFPVSVKWVTYMFNSWVNRSPNTTYPTIPLALQELAQERADLFVACPMYQFEYSDTSHLTGRSSKALGAYLGLAIKRAVFDEVEFAALGVIDHTKQGKVVNLKFKPTGKLVFDTTMVTNPGNYGFSLVDSAGTTLSIASVSIRYDMVSIVATATIPAGAKLRYAFIGGTTGQLPSRTTGPRGCLRDSQGDQILFDPEGVNWPLHNWALPFELAL